MIVGDLLLVMNGDQYFGPPIARVTGRAIFTVQVTNWSGTPNLFVEIEHRNRVDTGWTIAGSIAGIPSNMTVSQEIFGLKEIVRYTYRFVAGAPADGFYVVAAAPQWLQD